jgi:DNA-binding MarR family transcriptional regulator
MSATLLHLPDAAGGTLRPILAGSGRQRAGIYIGVRYIFVREVREVVGQDTLDRRVAIADRLNRLAALVIRLYTGGGLSLTAGATLAELTRSGPLRITELAVRMHVAQPSMTELVGRLQRDGLVHRTRGAADGRVVLVAVTPLGERTMDERRRLRARRVAGLLDRLEARDLDALEQSVPALDRLLERGTPDGVPEERESLHG